MKDNEGIYTYNIILWIFYLNKDIIYGTRDIYFCNLKLFILKLLKKEGIKKVIVNFERPTEDGFDSARCELPDYKWTEREGYSDEEIALFEELLHSNAHLLYKYAENGGIQIA